MSAALRSLDMSRFHAAVAAMVIAAAGIGYAAQHKIGQKGRVFSPGTMTIKAGDSVLFQNDDDVTHHIYSSTKGQEFDLETMPPGEKTAHAFASKGRVDVRCGLHAGMRLVITVQ
jgi:plastocyanin